MKKPTIFNSSEKELLITATQMSVQAAVKFPNQLARIEGLASEVLTMLKSEWDHYYASEYVNYIERVIKEYLQPYAEKIKTLLDTPLSQILEQKNVIPLDLKMVDKCNSILGKLGRRKTKINFADVLKRLHGNQEDQSSDVSQVAPASFEWEPVAKSETMLFELIPGESGVGANTILDHATQNATNNESEEAVQNYNGNSFIDLITEERSYREVA